MAQERKTSANELMCAKGEPLDTDISDYIKEPQKSVSNSVFLKEKSESLSCDLERLTIKYPSKTNENKQKKVNKKLGKSGKREVRLKKLPLLSSCKKERLDSLFIQKIRLCSTIFYNYSLSFIKFSSEIKTSTLEELIDYISDNGNIPSTAYPEIVQMFSANVFRTLPPRRISISNDFDSDEDVMLAVDADPHWPCLQMVYHFFMKFLETPKFEASLLKPFITKSFIISLLSAFESENPTERDFLKSVLHRLYSLFLSIRPIIRKQISYVFHTFVYETEVHNGIGEILEIIVSITHGFVVPVKEEHKIFLLKALMPLHTPKSFPTYYVQLIHCVTEYLAKDPFLTEPVLKSLIKYWPKRSSAKEVLFLQEVEEIIQSPEVLSELEKKRDVEILLLKQLVKCASSPHLQVSEKSLEILRTNLKFQETRALINEEFKADEIFNSLF